MLSKGTELALGSTAYSARNFRAPPTPTRAHPTPTHSPHLLLTLARRLTMRRVQRWWYNPSLVVHQDDFYVVLRRSNWTKSKTGKQLVFNSAFLCHGGIDDLGGDGQGVTCSQYNPWGSYNYQVRARSAYPAGIARPAWWHHVRTHRSRLLLALLYMTHMKSPLLP